VHCVSVVEEDGSRFQEGGSVEQLHEDVGHHNRDFDPQRSGLGKRVSKIGKRGSKTLEIRFR
jgi:hypothetical protein